jgi:8-amino-7-oxononanoate synthase
LRTDPGNIGAALAALDASALRRQRRVIESYPTPGDGSRVLVDGRLLRVFCSNDYLGLAQHREVIAALQTVSAQFGAGSGAAHLVTGHSAPHHQLEVELAAYTGRERALLFSTGYMANLGVLAAFAGRGEAVLEDRLNHASLIDGARLSGARLLRYRHADAGDAALVLAERADCAVIATDGLFSMDGDVAPLRELAELAARHRAWLVIDDAHGLGVLGASGRGSLEVAGLDARAAPLLVGTLGKAFGCCGAFVAGDEAVIELLVQRARTYTYTTALPPGVAAAASAALRVAQRESWRREQLQARVAQFRAGAIALQLPVTGSSSPIQPLIVGDAARALRLSRALYELGFWVTAIRPPTVPAGSARLRLTLSAAHSVADVDELLGALERAWQGEPRT